VGGLRSPLRSLLVTLAILAGVTWMQAHAVIAALHDESTIVRLAGAALAQPAVRDNIRSFTTDAVVRTAAGRGIDLSDSPALLLVTSALTSKKAVAASTPAWTAATAQLRTSLVSRLDADDPAMDGKPLTLDLGPVIRATGLRVPPSLASALGIPETGKVINVQVATGEQMQTIQTRYGYLVLIDRWAGWLALVLIAGAVLLSRHRVRTLAIAAVIGLAAALAVRPLLERVGEWLTGLGDWGVLARPLTDAIGVHAEPLSTTVATWCGIVAGVGVVALIVMRVLAYRARRPPRPLPPTPIRPAGPSAPTGVIERS
jgi:hypothetical protein